MFHFDATRENFARVLIGAFKIQINLKPRFIATSGQTQKSTL